MRLKLHERQSEVFHSEANEILYGGAAGGGKSYLIRALATALCLDNEGLQVYIFRRHYPDLISNHMTGSMSFPEMLSPFVQSGQCKINVGDFDINFTNGSAIHGRHCQHDHDVTKYLGAEFHVLLVDELTSFSEYQYRFLRSRLRLGGLKVKDRWKNRLPCIIAGSNPGGVGHQWVKRAFVDMCAPMEIKTMSKEEGGMKRQFIPAKLSDNPTLVENDPMYMERLSGLGNPDLVKAMQDGNWDIVAGAAFEKLSRSTHQIRAFTPKPYWTHYTSIDWGTAKPYSVGWYCVPDEDVVLTEKGGYREVVIPKNSIIRYREMYGWNGKPDEGRREESWQVAQKMLAYELDITDIIPDIEAQKDMSVAIKARRDEMKKKGIVGEKIDYRIGDSAMWAQHDGPSVAENFAKHGVVLEQSVKDRAGNYLEVRNRIAPPSGTPGFYVTDNCLHFWRTVPELQLDERQPEKGPDTRQEDHCFTAGTMVITSKGNKPIEEIKTDDEVLTTEGYRPCFSFGLTANSEVLEVTMEDSYKFQATGNHPVLTPSGTYVRLDKLRKGDKICALRCFQQKNKGLTASTITSADFTIKKGGYGFIGSCGSILMAPFRMAFMFITRMSLPAIIKLKTWICSRNQNICSTICKKDWQQMRGVKWLLKLLRPHRIKQKTGIRAQQAWNGIVSTLLKPLNFLQDFPASARFATKSFCPNTELHQCAEIIAEREILGLEILGISAAKEKKPVYNLHVPGPNNFVLENGLIVHNCYDEVSYALVSRPMVWTRQKRVENDYEDSRKKAFAAERGNESTGRYS